MWLLRPQNERFFDEDSKAHLDALFEAIFPAGDDAPGARDVAAVEYLDRLLAMEESTYYEIPHWRQLYREMLPAVNRASQTLYEGRGIADLRPEEAAGLLAQLQRGSVPGIDEGAQRRFFTTLRNHCIEGCFADPRWGGNRAGAMWAWYGYLQPAQPFRRGDRGMGQGDSG